jgi:hypothetical protein
MNATISPGAETALRKHVERAVRPVRAGRKRKLLMREELLAHLVALFVEERQRLGDDAEASDAEALLAAIARFGEPQALTAELNSAVGWPDRTKYFQEQLDPHLEAWVGLPYDISLWRHARRIAVIMSLVTLVAALSKLLYEWTFEPGRFADSTNDPVLWEVALVFLLCGLSGWGYWMALLATCRVCGERGERFHWLTAIVQALLWSTAFIIPLATFRWSSIESVVVVQSFLVRFWGVVPAINVALAWLRFVEVKRQQVYGEWQSLTLDE